MGQCTAAIYGCLTAIPPILHLALHHVVMQPIFWLDAFCLAGSGIWLMVAADREHTNIIGKSAKYHAQSGSGAVQPSFGSVWVAMCGAGPAGSAAMIAIGSRAFAACTVTWFVWYPSAFA